MMTHSPFSFRCSATLLGFALLTQLPSTSFAGTAVGAYWHYLTKQYPEQDNGTFNYQVLSSSNMSTPASSFTHTNQNGTLSLDASQGEIHLLNTFSVEAGLFGRYNGYSSNVDSQIGGGFEDTITISDSARTGQSGLYTGSIRVDLAFDSFAPNGNENIFGVGVGSSLANARSASHNVFYDNGGRSTYAYLGFSVSTAQSYAGQLVTFSVPFTFGEAFGMSVWMESNIGSGGYNREAMMLSHDASHTVTWAGTVLVEDAGGTDLAPASYNLTSGSGANYVNAIPEPSSAVLIAASLGIYGILRRRRR